MEESLAGVPLLESIMDTKGTNRKGNTPARKQKSDRPLPAKILE